jgi:hypothetical protein
VAVDDNYGIPASRILTVEASGVLDNDTLDGLNAGENGVTATLHTDVSKGTLSCPGVGPGLCEDGSFEYAPGPEFDGLDSFQYQAVSVSTSETSPPRTVTLSACSGGPTVYTCWHEASYLAKLSDLGYVNAFHESFEGVAWDIARSPITVPGVLSQGITWTTNHPTTNEITTGNGAARSGLWGVFDPEHGVATGTVTECDVDNPPVHCLPYDGFSGSSPDVLYGVGGYITGITGANVDIILDGVPHNAGKVTVPGYHFMGVIDTAGFNTFEYRELDGKVGQFLYIFGDDFTIATSATPTINNAPVLVPIGNQATDENSQLSIPLSASDPDDGDTFSFTISGTPAGAEFYDNGDGTADFIWNPDYSQAGSYPVTFTVFDSAIPAATDSETITITVDDVNRPPVLSAIGNKAVNESSLLMIMLTASDPDGNLLSFSKTAGPSGSSLIDNGDGTAMFSWTPGQGQAGDYPVTFTVADDGVPSANDSETITITVVNPVVDVTPPVITLLGIDPVSIEVGSTYTDAGATAYDSLDGDITASITTTSTVNTNIVGSYTVTYSVSDAAGNAATPVVRTVNVTADVASPVITLLGTTPVNIELGSIYSDAGATAFDNLDGDITTSITTISTVNTNVVGTYTVTYTVSDTAGNAATPVVRTVNVTPDVTPPVITLLGSNPVSIEVGSTYTDAGATATDNLDGDITAAITATSTVITNVVGSYTVTYNVTDAAGNLAMPVVRTVNVTTRANNAPVADAGLDQTVQVNDTVTLDGSSSSDLDGDTLTYSWSLTSPTGSSATLSDPSAVKPTFYVDMPGSYTAELTVNDGNVDSATESVLINTTNSIPVADAGIDQTAPVGATVTLDGSHSIDVDGDPLTFSWSLTLPAGSLASLSDSSEVKPTFDIDLPGTYIAQLVVNDGTADSAVDTTSISTTNSPPVADAGPDQTLLVEDTVFLDGSGSSDVDGDALSFSWSLTKPAGSTTLLSDPSAVKPSFFVDVPGTYVVQLIVNDSALDSTADTITISTVNSPPVADAGPDQTALIGNTIMLDGSGSSDVDGDALNFSWSLTTPAGSSANLSDPAVINPIFIIDVSGIYLAQLIVNDGSENSIADTVSITTTNSAPIADAGTDQTVIVNDTVTLDGNGSSDVDGDALTFNWALTVVPSGSMATLSAPTAVNPSFNADLPGTYLVQLIVNDGSVDSAAATVSIFADSGSPGDLQFSKARYKVNEADGSVILTVERVNGATGSVTVDYATLDDTARSGIDFTAASGTLVFATGVTTQSIVIKLTQDTASENNESLEISLDNPTGGAGLGTPVQAIVVIADDDTQADATETLTGGGSSGGSIDLCTLILLFSIYLRRFMRKSSSESQGPELNTRKIKAT